MMSIKALRSRASIIARRSSGLSKGGAARLMIAVRLVFQLSISQFISGASFLISFNSEIETKPGPVRSNWWAPSARIQRRRALMIVYSMPSR